MKQRQWLIAGIHGVAWIFFLLLPFMLIPGGLLAQLNQGDLLTILIQGFILIGLYYFNSLWMIPRLLARHHYKAYGALLLALVFVVPFALGKWPLIHLKPRPPMASDGQLPPRPPHPEWKRHEHGPGRPPDARMPLGPGIFMTVMVLTLSTGVTMTGRWLRTERELEQTARERTESELALLRSQFNPHFLFNTLNNLYALSVRKSDAAPEAILKLSGLMRYILEESSHDRVSLSKEVQSLHDYLDLQRLRLTKHTTVVFETENLTPDVQIPPLLLFPLVENAFKHGILPDQPSEIRILLCESDQKLTLTVTNAIPPNAPLTDSGRGLAQFRRRLHLLYGETATLTIGEKDGKFVAELTIPAEMQAILLLSA